MVASITLPGCQRLTAGTLIVHKHARVAPRALMKTSALATLTVAVLLALAPGRARAGVTVYNNAGMFAAAASGLTTYTFSGPPAGSSTYEGMSYTSGPLTFSGPGIVLYNENDYGSGVNYVSEDHGPETITLAGASAVGFTLGIFHAAETVNISVNGAMVTSVTEAGGAPDTLFIGFTDSVSITSLTFTNTSNTVYTGGNEIDVVGGYQTNAVPEPSTWALLGVGALGLLAWRKGRAACV